MFNAFCNGWNRKKCIQHMKKSFHKQRMKKDVNDLFRGQMLLVATFQGDSMKLI